MRYIGGKSKMLNYIENLINERTVDVETSADVFAGSGTVSTAFKWLGHKVISNDIMYSSYTLLRGTVGINKQPEFKGLFIGNVVEYLNRLEIEDTDFKIEDCFIYQNYSPNENCERSYFTPDNALRIDIIRLTIERWYKDGDINEDEYYYLKASLLEAVSDVANITGTYSAYLKHFDAHAKNRLNMVDFYVLDNERDNQVYNMDALNLASEVKIDLAYLDPPYNGRQYGSNYHVLETIARYDYPVIMGKTGVRDSANSSEYCLKNGAYKALDSLVKQLDCRYIIMSYSNEGLLDKSEVEEIFKRHGKPESYNLYEIPYKRFTSNNKTEDNGVFEQLYFIEK